MREWLLLAAVATGAPAAEPAQAAEPLPSSELLEFLGDWSEDEARQFLDGEDASRAGARPRASGTAEPAPAASDTKEHSHEP